MYLDVLQIKGMKLLRDVRLTFAEADDRPRQWTVFVGENGLCKTSLLQAIALAASGTIRASQLAGDLVGSFRDRRRPDSSTSIGAAFRFREGHHEGRTYPGLETSDKKPPRAPNVVSSVTTVKESEDLLGAAGYFGRDGREIVVERETSIPHAPPGAMERIDPLVDARSRRLKHWFVAGYGVGRQLPVPQSTGTDAREPTLDRVRSLFDSRHQILGTDFAGRFSPDELKDFERLLQRAFVHHGILPETQGLELRGRGGISRSVDVVESHQFAQRNGKAGSVNVPATWLSQGYQGTIAWVADLIGQVLLEAESTSIELEDMEGLVLIDEIDLHLHPRWQRTLVKSLSAAFPKMQFIATTHSPMVLPGLSADEIFRLRQDDEGNVVVEPSTESPEHMTGSEIYDAFFDIHQVRPEQTNDWLDDYGRLALNPFRSDAEEQQLTEFLSKLNASGIKPRWFPVPRKPSPPQP